MKATPRSLFLLHAVVTAYCMGCGLLGIYGHAELWIMPNIFFVFALGLSALVIPIAAIVSVVGSRCQHPVILVFSHIVMAVGQLLGLAALMA